MVFIAAQPGWYRVAEGNPIRPVIAFVVSDPDAPLRAVVAPLGGDDPAVVDGPFEYRGQPFDWLPADYQEV